MDSGSLLSARTLAQCTVLRKVGEVVYSQAENKTDISTVAGGAIQFYSKFSGFSLGEAFLELPFGPLVFRTQNVANCLTIN